MTDTIKDNIQAYHEQFKDNEWAHFLIPQIDFTKDIESNISAIIESNIKKAPLKTTVSFLAKNFAIKYPKAVVGLEIKQNATKNELACQIIKFVSLSHPETKDKMNTFKEKGSPEKNKKCHQHDKTKYENDTDDFQNYETPEEKFNPTTNSESSDDDSDPNYEIESNSTDEDEVELLDVSSTDKCDKGNVNNENCTNSPIENKNDSSHIEEENKMVTPNRNSVSPMAKKIDEGSDTEYITQSPLLTPYQKLKSPRLDDQLKTPKESTEYDESILNVINSIPDPESLRKETTKPTISKEKLTTKGKVDIRKTVLQRQQGMKTVFTSENNTDESESQIADKMKRLSIHGITPLKPIKMQKRKKKKYMVNKTKEVILKENENLNNKIDTLLKEKMELDGKNKALHKKLEAEENIQNELRHEIKKIEETIKDLDEENEKRIRHSLINENLEKQKIIEDLTKKMEEQKKRANEKQTEIKELKKINEKNTEEISNLKMVGEKETALRTKNEDLLTLKEERIKTLESKLGEKENGENQNIKTNEELKLIFSTEINKAKMTEEELLLEIQRINEELIFAKHEIKIRQEQINETVKAMTTQVTEINLAHMETFAHFKEEMQLKIKELENISENEQRESKKTTTEENKREINELQKEKQALLQKIEDMKNTQNTDKDGEIEKLQRELRKIGEEKYENIRSITKPRNKKQGIPNKYLNTCFIVSTIHALAETLEDHQYSNEQIMKILKDTKECLDGKRNEEQADEIITEIWEISKEKWPIYLRNEGTSNQEDAAEYLNRVIEDCAGLKKLCTMELAASQECSNPDCETMNITTRVKRNLSNPNTRDRTKADTIQNIIEKSLKTEDIYCEKCLETAKVSFKIIKAPDILCVHYPRTFENGEKLETKIGSPNSIQIQENQKNIEYEVKAIIIHKGTESGSGHYVCNVFNEEKNLWIQIDDHKIIEKRDIKEENQDGVIYLLKKVKSNSADNQAKQHIPCIAYKENRCRKGDNCPYRHHICEFYSRGYCRYEEQCQFRHVRSGNNNNQSNREPEYNDYDEREKIPNNFNQQGRPEYSNRRERDQSRNTYKYNIPCIHYRANQCRRGDECPYRHHTCRYYSKGNCRFAERCKFRHVEMENKPYSAEQNRKSNYYYQNYLANQRFPQENWKTYEESQYQENLNTNNPYQENITYNDTRYSNTNKQPLSNKKNNEYEARKDSESQYTNYRTYTYRNQNHL